MPRPPKPPAKRASRFSGVYPSGRASWQYRLLLPPDADGKRRQEVRGGFPTDEDAHAAREARKRQLGLGLNYDPRQITVAEWLEQYIAGLGAEVKPATIRQYRNWSTWYVVPHLGTIRLRDLTPAHVRIWVAALLKQPSQRAPRDKPRPLSANLVRKVRSFLSATLIQAVSDGLVEQNVVLHTRPPKGRRHVPNVWSDAEIGQFLRGVLERDDDYAAMWWLAVLAQLRPGELQALRWDDVDLRNGIVHVRETRTSTEDGVMVTGPAKTPASIARVDLPASCVDLLRQHRRKLAQRRLSAPPGRWQDHGFVFPGRDGRMLAYDRILDRLTTLCRALDLPRLTPHELRHSGATMLARARENPKGISQRLRHASVAYTLDVYVTLAEDEQQAISERLDARFTGTDIH